MKNSIKLKTIECIPMYLDPTDGGISRGLLNKGCRERAFIWIQKREAKGIAFDIGANIGYNTLKMGLTCKKIYAFEPDDRSMKLLRKNIELNNLGEKVSLYDCAVSDKTGEVQFYLAEKPNISSIHIKSKDMITVKSITLDDFCKRENVYPDFIKMDIQGAEVNVLNGMQNILDCSFPKFLIELHPEYYSKENDFRACLETLLEKGYYFKYVVNAKGGTKKIFDYTEVRKFRNAKRSVFENVPTDKVLTWATEMPENGKKNLRAIFMEKKH